MKSGPDIFLLLVIGQCEVGGGCTRTPTEWRRLGSNPRPSGQRTTRCSPWATAALITEQVDWQTRHMCLFFILFSYSWLSVVGSCLWSVVIPLWLFRVSAVFLKESLWGWISFLFPHVVSICGLFTCRVFILPWLWLFSICGCCVCLWFLFGPL